MKAALPITRCLVGGSDGKSDESSKEATALALNQLLELVQVGEINCVCEVHVGVSRHLCEGTL